jgi:spore coat polysaccharide biosynthesis protein SpsF
MSSKRLPGKSLMKIAGFPLAVLSALRAGNTGIRVVIVTSTESSDDVLFNEVSSYGIECFRGNLNNVLLRFKEAADYLRLSQDSLIIRLTGDNVVPDGGLIDELIALYVNNKQIGYVGADFPNDNLPYGVNVEIFTVSSLEDAFINASSNFDLVHVTPWIKRNNNCSGMSPYISTNQRPYISSELSLTIDNYNELEMMRSIFDKVNEPIDESWFKICQLGFKSKP